MLPEEVSNGHHLRVSVPLRGKYRGEDIYTG